MLPTQKKTPEEIAKLRETIGVPPLAPAADGPVEPLVNADPPAAAPAPAPAPEGLPAPAAPDSEPPRHRRLGSMKRHETLAPAPPHAASATQLPDHRHSQTELAELRRHQALSSITGGGFAMPLAAPASLLGLAYFLAVGGALAPLVMLWFARFIDYQIGQSCSQGFGLLLAGCGLAIPIAAYIALRCTLSRHHAAFIGIISVLAILFSLLHFFPALRYAS